MGQEEQKWADGRKWRDRWLRFSGSDKMNVFFLCKGLRYCQLNPVHYNKLKRIDNISSI